MQREGVRHPKHLRYSVGTFLKICICTKKYMYKIDGGGRKEVFFIIFGLIELPMSFRPTYQHKQCWNKNQVVRLKRTKIVCCLILSQYHQYKFARDWNHPAELPTDRGVSMESPSNVFYLTTEKGKHRVNLKGRNRGPTTKKSRESR